MRMRISLATLLVVSLLGACAAPAPMPTPTPLPTATATVTPTVTPTPIPTLPPEQLGGLGGVPDPRYSNPELFDLNKSDAPIPQFVHAMRMAGVEINPQQIVGSLASEQKTGVDSKPFIIGYYNLDPDPTKTGEPLEGKIPLLLATQDDQGEWIWKKITIRDLAERIDVKIGSQVIWEGLVDPRISGSYKRISATEFNELVIDGELHWGGTLTGPLKAIHPERNVYSFEKTDALVDFAENNGMSIQAHHLVWGIYWNPQMTTLPDWILKGNFSRQELIAIMQEHIQAVMTRYKDRIRSYTVVNEPYPYSQGADFWMDNIGEKYIEIAFETARKTDPNAILILDDATNYLWDSQRTQYDFKVVRQLRSKTVVAGGENYPLIDAIGIQMHIDASKAPTKEQLMLTMKTFGEAGVRVYVTESLVDVSKLTGTDKEKQFIQAGIYADMLGACLESGVCDGFAIFGFSDVTSKYVVGSNTYASPWDEDFRPRAGYFAMLRVLMDYVK